MTVRIPDLLDAILEATADEATAKARIAGIRAVLEDEARRRFQAEGAAPTWTAPQLGKVRYDAPGSWRAMVHDHDAFGSWVAEHYPSEATGVIRVPAEQLETVMAAIGFALSEEVSAAVSVAVEVRPAWSGTFLEGLAVDVEETTTDEGTDREFTIADPISGELVPGTTGTRSSAKLVVSLDRDRRTIALTEARETAEAIIARATEGEAPPEADRAALDHRRRELEGMPAEVLTEVARRMELGASGTKPALAERIARAEALAGHEFPIHRLAVEHPANEVRIGSDLEPIPAAEEPERGSVEYLEAKRAEAIEACGSREQLRAYAKANGVAPSGTKTDVAKRLAAAGHTADAIAAS
jgi:hypothetical protein